ncbi:hypothetical protein [Streptomyces fagopyri]|uniref:hypothetical protein n=1 Tax=Streptomyces fagopyri TaxID=2662397 RepID=UPI00382CBAEB
MNADTTSGATPESVVVGGLELTSDPASQARFAESAHRILADLVVGGAALGWVEPPSRDEVTELLGHVLAAVRAGNAVLRAASLGDRLVEPGYWPRYRSPMSFHSLDVPAAEAHPESCFLNAWKISPTSAR